MRLDAGKGGGKQLRQEGRGKPSSGENGDRIFSTEDTGGNFHCRKGDGDVCGRKGERRSYSRKKKEPSGKTKRERKPLGQKGEQNSRDHERDIRIVVQQETGNPCGRKGRNLNS